MQSENASCVIDSAAVDSVTSIDVAADGSMIIWTTAEFVFFTCVNKGHWSKGTKEPKPAVIKLCMSEADETKFAAELKSPPPWRPVKFDAATHKDEHGLYEREIISYFGRLQVRWSVREARRVWEAHTEDNGQPALLEGNTADMQAQVRMSVMMDPSHLEAVNPISLPPLRYSPSLMPSPISHLSYPATRYPPPPVSPSFPRRCIAT